MEWSVAISTGTFKRDDGQYEEAIRYFNKALVIAQSNGSKNEETKTLLHFAALYMLIKKYPEADVYLEKALTIVQETGDKELEWVILFELGGSKEQGQDEESLRYLNRALVIARSSGSKEKEAQTLRSLASLYMSTKKYPEAADYFEKGLAIVQETGDKKLEWKMCGGLAESKHKQGLNEESIRYLNKALVIAQSSRSKEKEAETLQNFAALYQSITKYPEAVDCYEKGLTIVQETGDKELEWKICVGLAQSKHKQGLNEESIRYYNEALVIAQSSRSKEKEAETLQLLGEFYSLIGKFHEAVNHYKKWLPIVQEIGNKGLECMMTIHLGDSYRKLGQYNDAMKYSKQGLDIALRTEDSKLIARSYYNLGNTYNNLYEYQNSMKCYNKAIDMYKQLEDEEGLRRCYTNLASSYLQQGKYHDAINFQEESLRIGDKIGNKEEKAQSLFLLGNIHLTLNNCKKAENIYKQSLTIAKEINHKGLQGKCYVNLGTVLSNYGNYLDAIPYYLESLTIATELDDKQAKAIANLNIGNCYKGMNLYKEANEYYSNSLVIAKEIKAKHIEALVYYNIAVVHFRSDTFQQAITMAEKSLDISLSIVDKESEGMTCHLLGKIYHSLAKDNNDHEKHVTYMAESEKYLKKALDCYDYMFSQLHQRDQFKISIFDSFIGTYKLLTTVLIETQQTQQALLVTDRGRARALGDCLSFTYGMSPQEDLSSKPLTYPDVENVLSNDTFTLLHYTLLDDSLVVWVLSKDSITFKQTDKQQFVSAVETLFGEKKEEQQDTINSFFADTVAKAYDNMKIKEGVTSVDESVQDLHPLAVLYNVLVAPVLSHIQHDEIVIVPDGMMYTVPFTALIDPNTGKYLSETKRIRLVPSITILKVLQECPVDHHSQQGALIVGNPSVGEVVFRGKKKIFEHLRFAELEARCITRLLKNAPRRPGNPNITSLTGKEATKDEVLSKLKEGVAIIHIAAHGNAEYGEIALAPIPSQDRQGLPDEQDYLLTMKEVQRVGIKAQLVVLSCCHSGLGEIRAEGVVGLSRAFLTAGARAVVASLWAINDDATLSFMVSFYECLCRGESASVSLDKAIKDIRKDHIDPTYWAPFFLIGDDVTIKFGQ